MYTKDINATYMYDANSKAPDGTVKQVSALTQEDTILLLLQGELIPVSPVMQWFWQALIKEIHLYLQHR